MQIYAKEISIAGNTGKSKAFVGGASHIIYQSFAHFKYYILTEKSGDGFLFENNTETVLIFCLYGIYVMDLK